MQFSKESESIYENSSIEPLLDGTVLIEEDVKDALFKQ